MKRLNNEESGKARRLVKALLYDSLEEMYSDASCNDWYWPEEWSDEDKELVARWLGKDPEFDTDLLEKLRQDERV